MSEYDGSITTLLPFPDRCRRRPNPTWRCLYPDAPPPGTVPTCARNGVLGALLGVMGSLQALEVIKLIAGIGEPLVGRLMLFDARSLRFDTIRYHWKPRQSPERPRCPCRNAPMTPADPVAILAGLIACPSVTPDEGGALHLLGRLLADIGFEVHLPVFSEDGTPDITNLFARIGSGAPHLAFAGHTDVVPPGHAGAWRHPPFAARIEAGVLYGRGAVDMKGGIAAFVAAVTDYLAAQPLRGTISFLITGDEEGPAHQWHGQAARLGGAAWRALRCGPCRRADQPGPHWRRHEGRAARFAVGHGDGDGQTGPCRLSAPRRQPDSRPDAAGRQPGGRTARQRQ